MNLTDPFRGVISILINRLLQGKPPILYGNGNQLRAFTYVEDIVPFIAKAGFSEESNKQIINLGSGQKTKLRDLAKILCKLTGYTKDILYFPPRLGEAEDAYTTTEKSERLLGFKDKTSLYDGLSYTLNWARKQEIKSFDYERLQFDLDLESLPFTWKNRIL
jgi:UDP-glucose 4-epimerase